MQLVCRPLPVVPIRGVEGVRGVEGAYRVFGVFEPGEERDQGERARVPTYGPVRAPVALARV